MENADQNNQINLVASISNNFADVVQLNGINTAGNAVTVAQVCGIMTNKQLGTPVERIAVVTETVLQEHNEKKLYFDYKIMIKQLADTSIESEVATGGYRQWLYQMCTQMGFFQTTDHKPHIFGQMIPMNFFFNQCTHVFGKTINATSMPKGIQRNNVNHGGLLPHVKNVVSVQGSYDPWHAVGIIKTIPNRVEAIFIPGTAHCADLYASSPSDPPQLTAARTKVVQFLSLLLLTDESSSATTNENVIKSSPAKSNDIADSSNDNSEFAVASSMDNGLEDNNSIANLAKNSNLVQHNSPENNFEENFLRSLNSTGLLSF